MVAVVGAGACCDDVAVGNGRKRQNTRMCSTARDPDVDAMLVDAALAMAPTIDNDGEGGDSSSVQKAIGDASLECHG